MHWIIRDIANDANTFSGKTLRFEENVANARGTTSFIDVFCEQCIPPNLKIEYKSGPGSITAGTIKDQFIERDLFSAENLNEIQWRMTNTGMTKEKMVDWMKANKTSLEQILNADPARRSKIASWFNLARGTTTIPDQKIIDFVNNNYTTIFR
ncbi:hypothetical protein IC235_15010 [Hymenobacter sp. BT664]|uniref:Uncharacterized protein n=1 Tax=Hymenobacter montanus TaxID=2771359 RepID=A0A927BFA5_9BACT|nr:hypothetical protein [Hymenobacter montanus]MBD2769200.1 hypothetical protein [Hymenobacter montanus]